VRYIDRWCCVVEHSVDEQYDAYPLFGWERQIDRYHISDDVLSSFKKEGFDGCCRILQRTTSRPIDIRIRRALEYFGYGMGMDNIHQRYVTYVASLEALLLGDNERRGIDRKLSYRISCLLEQDASKRERLRGSIEWLYGLRCRIVHGASPAPAEVAVGLTSLRWALYSLLRRLATNPDNFSSVDDIAKWTKAQLG
jgi:hypothetical protein